MFIIIAYCIICGEMDAIASADISFLIELYVGKVRSADINIIIILLLGNGRYMYLGRQFSGSDGIHYDGSTEKEKRHPRGTRPRLSVIHGQFLHRLSI